MGGIPRIPLVASARETSWAVIAAIRAASLIRRSLSFSGVPPKLSTVRIPQPFVESALITA